MRYYIRWNGTPSEAQCRKRRIISVASKKIMPRGICGQRRPRSDQELRSIPATLENMPSDIRARRRLRSACASAQSHQSTLSIRRNLASMAIRNAPVKILIRLRESAGWSESSLGAHVDSNKSMYWEGRYQFGRLHLVTRFFSLPKTSFLTASRILFIKEGPGKSVSDMLSVVYTI